jgi:hypothetical protein
MQHIQGCFRSHLLLPLGDYWLCIARVAARATGKQTTINKYTYKAECFDGHEDALVCNCAHRPMEEVQGFTRGHWMLPLGKYYVRQHKRDMAMAVFFMFLIVKIVGKGHGLTLRPLFLIGV